MNRRQLICGAGAGLIAGASVGANANTYSSPRQNDPRGYSFEQGTLSLADYEPTSMLQVSETHVARSRYPVIDTHTHISYSARLVNGVELGVQGAVERKTGLSA